VKNLIVTADDFGAASAVNEAVEQGHAHGILTAASLMVAGVAAEEAVAIARRTPTLGVGLHLVLVDGRPILPADRVPDLVGPGGRFRDDMVRAGVDFFFRPRVRRQLAAEIGAQFAAFAATGLPLDHVNAHKHFHLHPTIAGLIVGIGARYGLRGARAPVEPAAVLEKVERVAHGITDRIAAPYARLVARRFRRAGLTVPRQVFGLAWSGAMDTARVAGLIYNLPPGLSELYLHPATDDLYPGHAPGYRYRAELAALRDDRVRAVVEEQGIALGRFSDFDGKEAMQ
jgi:hopanoid biosynthesis associated protein HpnK